VVSATREKAGRMPKGLYEKLPIPCERKSLEEPD
jgi:hypothetical protein